MEIIKKTRQRVILVVTFCFFILFISCKAKKNSSLTVSNTDETSNSLKTEGKVTHQYKLMGCETIIICKPTTENDTLFLIPMTPLEKFDIDGLQISFNYRILRIHNPKGCKQGIPAQISNIKKLKER